MLKVFVINQTIFCAIHLFSIYQLAEWLWSHSRHYSLSSICITCKHTLSISVY